MLGVVITLMASEAVVLIVGAIDRRIAGDHVTTGARRRGVRADESESSGRTNVVECCTDPRVDSVTADAVGGETSAVLGVMITLMASETVVLIVGAKNRLESGHHMATSAGRHLVCAEQLESARRRHVVECGGGPDVDGVAAHTVGRESATVLGVIIGLMAADTVTLCRSWEEGFEAGHDVTTLATRNRMCTNELETTGHGDVVEPLAPTPRQRVVAVLAFCTEVAFNVVDRLGGVVILFVAREAIGVEGGKCSSAIIYVARFTGNLDMSAAQRKRGLSVHQDASDVTEVEGVVALGTRFGLVALVHVNVAAGAIRVRGLWLVEASAEVTADAGGVGMASGELERRRTVVIEVHLGFSRAPSVRGVTRAAVGVGRQRAVRVLGTQTRRLGRGAEWKAHAQRAQ
ncbi:MAG: hypothetical protein OEO17_05805 [Gemmatimonadota bacterium]|nr:hypothetical protein [Gemmatimonadota bacterium]